MPAQKLQGASVVAMTKTMPTLEPNCPLCILPADRILLQEELALAVRDAFPVSPGHTLLIPRRHVCSFFETTKEERGALLELLDAAKEAIEQDHAPDGYNIGINDRPAAGQTLPHLHVHVIPRYSGDHPDPRGGVRWVLPSKANYWS